MSREIAEHFYNWLSLYVAERNQHEVEQKIHKLLAEYPDLPDNHGWPEMLGMADRLGLTGE